MKHHDETAMKSDAAKTMQHEQAPMADVKMEAQTPTVGLSVRLEAKPGRETDLEALLRGAAFGIFDAFADEAGREAHLAGRIAAALGEHAPALLVAPPAIERIEVLAAKLP